MKESRRRYIENKVFSKGNLRLLWNSIKKEYTPNGFSSSIRLTVNGTDGTDYESEDDDLLSEGDIVDIKKLNQVSMTYRDSQAGKSINLSLSEGEAGYSKLIITGEDRNWVAGTFDKMTAILDAIKPQEHWLVKNKKTVIILAYFLFGSLYNIIFFPNLKLNEVLHIHRVLGVLLALPFYFLTGLFFLNSATSWVYKLWPSIEFDFGPEHRKLQKRRRARLGLLVGLVIIPIVVDLIINLITTLVKA